MPANKVSTKSDKIKRSPESEKQLMIIQLNCNGIKNKLVELKVLTYNTKPDILCLCETFTKPNYEPKFMGYNSHWSHRQGHKGGLGILIRRDLSFKIRTLIPFNNPKLEIQCIQLFSSGEPIDIVNIYNPQKSITEEELHHYAAQLSDHSILIGDFNAHSPIWDQRGRSNTSGSSIEQFITNSNFHLLNDCNTPTYLDHRHNTSSCLDLCIVSTPLMRVGEFSRGRDVGSDHFPIICIFNFHLERDTEEVMKRWKYSSADWEKYATILENTNSDINFPLDAESHNKVLTDQIVEAASQAIGKTSGRKGLRRHFSGWDSECTQIVKERRKARNKLWKNPTIGNLINWKKMRALARKTVKEKRTLSFQTFVNTIDSNTPSKTIWNKIKSLNGQKTSSSPTLGDPSHDKKTTANLFLTHFTRFKPPPVCPDVSKIDQTIDELEIDSGEIPTISLQEVQKTLMKLKNNSPGQDQVSNYLLKKLPFPQLTSLTSLFNVSLHSSYIPIAWKIGVSCPILKPGKDPCQIPSCRPITMLSCIGKVLERIIQQRLEYFLENNQVFNSSQLGFRKGYGTTEALATIINFITSQKDKKYTVAVYIDLESAFDRVWHQGVLFKLKELNIPTYLLKWIKNYFQDREICTRYKDFITSTKPLTVGVPQGAVLSPILFNVMLHDLPTDNNVKIITYADDITLLSSDTKIEEAKRTMQNYLNKLIDWLQKWKMNVNPQKCTYQIFTTKRLVPNITLRMHNHSLRYVAIQRVLGVLLDAPRLTFEGHIGSLVGESKKRLHIIRVLSSTDWGCSRTLLRRVFTAYIRSKIEYGTYLFHHIRPKSIHKINLIQNEAMRCITGARKTSPILSLQIEVFLPPIELRLQYLFTKWYIKCSSTKAKKDIVNTICTNRFRELINNMNLPYLNISAQPIISAFPPWTDLSDRVVLDLPLSWSNSEKNDSLFNSYIQINYPEHIPIYTDGSKLQDGMTSASVYVPDLGVAEAYKINEAHNVMGAELFAILKALIISSRMINDNKIIILSDSQSALQAISNINTPSFRNIIQPIQKILSQNEQITLHWVKAHCGIKGNEIADTTANLAHSNIISTLSPITVEEYSSLLWKKLILYWEKRWKEEVNLTNKGKFMAEQLSHIEESDWYEIKPRKMESVVSRFRIGHVGVYNHLHRFEMADSPLCGRCLSPETIEHFLMHCPLYTAQRIKLKNTLLKLKVNFSLSNILGFGTSTKQEKEEILKAFITYLGQSGQMSRF